MDKRYQVFVSSTYADLQEERQKVLQALMEMDCIPAGMELFPAADDEQWQFIKRVIDDCDYYLLIIGGRYGSVTDEGISYTEMEFDYAISRGIKVLAFIHEAPDNLSVAKSDIDSTLRTKLDLFRKKVSTGRLVKFWHNQSELPGLVALSLQKTIKLYPAVGWVRGGGTENPELLSDLNALRKRNDQLKARVAELESASPPLAVQSLASLDEPFTVKVVWKTYHSSIRDYKHHHDSITASWAQIFAMIAPSLQQHPSDSSVQSLLGGALYRKQHGQDLRGITIDVDNDDFQTIRVQLSALKLISADYTKTIQGGVGFFWSLTQQGERLMLELRTVKTQSKA